MGDKESKKGYPYVCGSQSILLVSCNGTGGTIVFPRLCCKTSCPRCKRKRDKRIMQQVLAEQEIAPLWWDRVGADDVQRIRRRLRDKVYLRKAGSYKTFPQKADGSMVFITSWDSALPDAKPVPTDLDELGEFIAGISHTPEGKRLGGSHGFGGDHQGMRQKKEKRYDRFFVNAPKYRVLELADEALADEKWLPSTNDTSERGACYIDGTPAQDKKILWKISCTEGVSISDKNDGATLDGYLWDSNED